MIKKKEQKSYGAIISVNIGRDKKSGKVIRLSQAIATTDISKKRAMETFKKELEKIKKRKDVTKSFGIYPVVINDKMTFIKNKMSPWTEKYRPKKFEEIFEQEEALLTNFVLTSLGKEQK